MDRAEQVRQILAARGLTLYRVSQQAIQRFGRSSPFFVPHNLYYDVRDTSLAPTIHQVFALSRITNFRLSDWLVVFGFDLDGISRLRQLIPTQQTIRLDSTTYDTEAWIPWFAGKPWSGPMPAIAPLGQLLAADAPRRAVELLARNQQKFTYAKVGKADLRAFPHLGAGSIIRVDPRQTESLVSSARSPWEQKLFFVEHNSGWTCSQLSLLAGDRILLRSPQYPCAQIELRLGKEARVLGVIDAEIRRLGYSCAPGLDYSPPVPKPSLSSAANRQDGLSHLLRKSRISAGLSFREACSVSRWIASRLSDELYFAAASTLSDYETLSTPPRHIQKMITLCLLYCIDFEKFLRVSGLPMDQAGREPMPDELVSRWMPGKNQGHHAARKAPPSREDDGIVGSLVDQWEEIPLFLRHSLSEITGHNRFSLADVYWVGGIEAPLHSLLVNAALVAVNRRVKKPAEPAGKTACERPLYMVLRRDGGYLCGRCTLEEGNLVVHSYPGGPAGKRQFRYRADAEIVGQVTTILRRLR